MRFFDFLFPPRSDEKLIREMTPDALLNLLKPQTIALEHGTAIALLPFQEPVVRAAVHEAKYHGSEKALTLIASALTEYLRDHDELSSLTQSVLVPVPLGITRERERGFNQAAEIARHTGMALGIPLASGLLARTRETASQVSLPRLKRLENMRGAFKATHPCNTEHLYIVIDDVLTTGATLGAASTALREAGAVHLLPIALAH